MEKIVATFRKSDYSPEDDSADIQKLVGEMQDLGGPPKEIVGDLPGGLVSFSIFDISEYTNLTISGSRRWG